jgi:hypothetical protein
LTVLDSPPIQITAFDSIISDEPSAVASDGTDYLVVWRRKTVAPGLPALFGRLMLGANGLPKFPLFPELELAPDDVSERSAPAFPESARSFTPGVGKPLSLDLPLHEHLEARAHEARVSE